ncbi:mannosyltransferase [Pseudomonas stutzeri]|nr:mannosyltransferase [Stutzerimonas decontaminans]
MPLQAKRCLASWAYYLPDYEVVRWDEAAFDPASHPFTAAAHSAGKFAFVADYVRMHVLAKEGGIYLDVDVEVCASFDELLDNEFFIGLEDRQRFATAVIGASVGHWLPVHMLEYYGRVQFDEERLSELVNVNEVSRLMLARGFTGSGEEEFRGTERVLGVGRLADAVRAPKVGIQPLARHLYAGSWRRRDGKSLASRLARSARKVPEHLGAWLAWQMFRLRTRLRRFRHR